MSIALIRKISAYFIILAFMPLLTMCTDGRKPLTKVRVLIIYSYGKGNQFSSSTNTLLYKTMLERGYRVSVDCIGIGNEVEGVDRSEQLAMQLKNFDLLQPDIVVTEGEEATSAYLHCGHKWVYHRPLLFAHAFSDFKAERALHSNIYGVMYCPDYATNARLARTLFGNRTIEMIANESTLGHIVIDYFNSTINTHEFNVSWQAVKRDSLGRIAYDAEGDRREVDRTNSVKQDMCFVSYADMTSDDVMFHFSPSRMKRRVFLHTGFSTFSLGLCCIISCPIINVTFSGFSDGLNVVGGYFATPEEIIGRLSDQIENIINSDIKAPKVINCTPTYNFDYKLLQRWHVDMSELPADSNVINMPFSVRYRYVYYMLLTILLVGLVVLIVMTVVAIKSSIKRKQRALELARINSEYLLSIGGGRACTWWFSSKDDVFHFDRRLVDITGRDQMVYDRSEIVNFVYPDDQHYFDYFKVSSLFGTQNNSFEFRANLNGDGFRWFKALFSSRKQEGDNFMFGGLILDIQDYKDSERQLEEAIQQVKSSNLKQSFLANMSHEIRTPLNAVVGFSNLLTDSNFADTITPEERKEYMELVSSNSELLQNIIDSILEISSIESGGLQFVINSYPIERLTREIYNSYQIVVRKDLSFFYAPTSVEAEVDVDKLRFMQVFDNLLSNSNKFTQSGYIKFGSEFREETSEVVFFVEDSGKGISVENQKRIFERFYKADENDVGTGLGLPLCKLITEKMGGTIGVISELGKGARFEVVFPCRRKGGGK